MTIIVCQQCDRVIDYIEDEKVSTLYASCCNCEKKKKEMTNKCIHGSYM